MSDSHNRAPGGIAVSDHITIKLTRVNDVIDLEDFAALFAGLGSQFDDFLKQKYPEVHGHASMGIRELREGSIIAELAAVIVTNAIATMDATAVVRHFMVLINRRYETLTEGKFLEGARKKDLSSIAQSVQAIAKDADAQATYEHNEFDSSGTLRKETKFFLKTEQARRIVETTDRQKRHLDKTEGVDHERVLMIFTRADVGNARIDRKSGEMVVIEEVSDRELSLIYQSKSAEDRIKWEIRAGDSVFRKGFVVDANVRTRGGSPVAFAVVNVHDVIDLPDDDGNGKNK